MGLLHNEEAASFAQPIQTTSEAKVFVLFSYSLMVDYPIIKEIRLAAILDTNWRIFKNLVYSL